MTFISYEFLILLAIVLIGCWTLSHRSTNWFLLAVSYVFYGWWDWRFLGLLLLSSLVDYVCGRLIDGRVPDHRRIDVLAVSLSVNLGLLLTFKYFEFFHESFAQAMHSLGIEIGRPWFQVILPVGISFYTFQTLSYTIDVYRRKIHATDRLIDFMLYVSFFPQLVAGPIERASHLLPQIMHPRHIRWDAVSSGAQLVLVGFFKKMVIADNLAPIVDSAYKISGGANVIENGLMILIATYAFAFQIYCDFSGYTDIARGVARMIGFDLCLNFRLPYFATNPSDFWRRWHISLSTWFRDYVYIPLGGNRDSGSLRLRNLIIVMFLAGLWHGASWNFVIWGLYHGFLLVVFHLASRNLANLNLANLNLANLNLANLNLASRHDLPTQAQSNVQPGWLFWLKAFGFFQLTCIGWLIFRVESLNQFLQMAGCLIDLRTWNLSTIDATTIYPLLLLSLPLVAFQVYQHRRDHLEPWIQWPFALRVVFYLTLFYGIVLLGTPENNEFIYFQF
ncbi:MAG: MBOAT family O-acyltransferase [Pirellulaceae bacterium]